MQIGHPSPFRLTQSAVQPAENAGQPFRFAPTFADDVIDDVGDDAEDDVEDDPVDDVSLPGKHKC